MDRHSSDGYKNCRGLRILSQALSCNFWHALGRRVRALRSLLRLSLSSLSSNTTTIKKLIRPRGGQGIRAWALRTYAACIMKISTNYCRDRIGDTTPDMPCTLDNTNRYAYWSVNRSEHYISIPIVPCNRRVKCPWIPISLTNRFREICTTGYRSQDRYILEIV